MGHSTNDTRQRRVPIVDRQMPTVAPFCRSPIVECRIHLEITIRHIVSVTISSIFGNNYLKQLLNDGGQPPANLKEPCSCTAKKLFLSVVLVVSPTSCLSPYQHFRDRAAGAKHLYRHRKTRKLSVLEIGTGNIITLATFPNRV